jgi:hypothetical protein
MPVTSAGWFPRLTVVAFVVICAIASAGTVPKISVAGRAPASLQPRAIDDAFQAFSELQALTEGSVPVRPARYAARLKETLPRIQAFISNSGESWADVRLVMAEAVEAYQAALDGWSNATLFWTAASRVLEFARTLASQEGEELHREQAIERDIALGTQVSGRLGAGDRIMPRETDRSTEGAFNDVYRLRVDRPVNVVLQLATVHCFAHLTLTDDAGKQIDGNMGRPDGKITKLLTPGVYHVWAGASIANRVGTYVLTVSGR